MSTIYTKIHYWVAEKPQDKCASQLLVTMTTYLRKTGFSPWSLGFWEVKWSRSSHSGQEAGRRNGARDKIGFKGMALITSFFQQGLMSHHLHHHQGITINEVWAVRLQSLCIPGPAGLEKAFTTGALEGTLPIQTMINSNGCFLSSSPSAAYAGLQHKQFSFLSLSSAMTKGLNLR